MTAEGLRDLEKELEELKTVGRKEAAEKIKVARSFGDLSDPDEGKISDESPVGKALIGHKVGETVEVEAPIGLLKFVIKDISK